MTAAAGRSAGSTAALRRPLPGLATPAARCLVMGVLNVTPDSFSDGGCYAGTEAAVEHGRLMAAQGADLVDVGGESTRPGAVRVPATEELRRVLPVVAALAEAGVAVSIDTSRAEVAAACLDRGAVLVNDVRGGAADPAMAPMVAERGVAYVAMHTRGDSREMTERTAYPAGVVATVTAELLDRYAALLAAGVAPEQVVLDPGLGFAKTPAQSWALLAALPDLAAALGRPLLVGASRKGMLGSLLSGADGAARGVEARDAATAAVSALAARAGAWAVRVHDVPASLDAVRVAAAWSAAEVVGG